MNWYQETCPLSSCVSRHSYSLDGSKLNKQLDQACFLLLYWHFSPKVIKQVCPGHLSTKSIYYFNFYFKFNIQITCQKMNHITIDILLYYILDGCKNILGFPSERKTGISSSKINVYFTEWCHSRNVVIIGNISFWIRAYIRLILTNESVKHMQ